MTTITASVTTTQASSVNQALPDTSNFPATSVPPNTDLADCTCDLTQDVCDINCCCDENCSTDDRVVFSACEEEHATPNTDLCTYEVKVFKDFSVSTNQVNNPAVFCIWRESYAARKYYTPLELVRTPEQFASYQIKSSGFTYQYESPDVVSVASYYKTGQYIVTVSGLRQGLLTVPTKLSHSSSCVNNNSAKFLNDVSSTCMRNLATPLSFSCEANKDLSAYELSRSLASTVSLL